MGASSTGSAPLTHATIKSLAHTQKLASKKKKMIKPTQAFHFSRKRDSAVDTLLPGHRRNLNAVAWEIGCHIVSQYEEVERRRLDRAAKSAQKKLEKANLKEETARKRWLEDRMAEAGISSKDSTKAPGATIFVSTGDHEENEDHMQKLK